MKLTKQQIDWASRHDWFIKDNGDGSITCIECWTKEGRYGEEIVIHNNFRALRDWAGY